MFAMKVIPNAVTLLNLFGGTVSIVLAMNGLPHYSALVIIGCMVLDFLDGALAQLLNARSEMGVQLDSLADLVSFGIAPAAIVFHYLSLSVFGLPPGALKTAVPFLAFVITVFSAIRLARYNLEGSQSNDFYGLPTPANAFFFASWPVVLHFFPEKGLFYSLLLNIVNSVPNILLLVGFFSALMVSRIPMFSFKIKGFGLRENKIRMIFIALIILSVLALGMPAVVLIIVFYIILSITSYLFGN